MDYETLSQRILDTIDDLGKLLDYLHKFPQKIRQKYYQQINLIKNKLLQLKTILRDSNVSKICTQFQHNYKTYLQLKQSITGSQQPKLKQTNKLKPKTHSQNMILLAQKTQKAKQLQIELNNLKCKLQQNENYTQTIIKNQTEIQMENKKLKYQNKQLNLQISLHKQRARKLNCQVQTLYKSQFQANQALQQAKHQIISLHTMLTVSEEKMAEFEALADMNLTKAKVMEDNLNTYEREVRQWKDHSFAKQNQLKDQLAKLQQQSKAYKQETRDYRDSAERSSRLAKEYSNLQKQLSQAQMVIFASKQEHQKYKRWKDNQLQVLNNQIQKSLNQNEKVRQEIQYLRKENQGMKAKIAQRNEIENENLILKDRNQNMKIENQNWLRKEKDMQYELLKNCQQTEKILEMNKKIELQLQNKDNRIKQLQKTIQNKRRENLEAQRRNQQSEFKKGYQQMEIERKEQEKIQQKLLKAKIQALHQIREAIS